MPSANGVSVWVIIIVVTLGMIALVTIYYWQPRHSTDCLDETGTEYCLSNDYSNYRNVQSYFNSKDFLCYNELGNERDGTTIESEDFYFLSEEKELCKTKDSKSFKILTLSTSSTKEKKDAR